MSVCVGGRLAVALAMAEWLVKRVLLFVYGYGAICGLRISILIRKVKIYSSSFKARNLFGIGMSCRLVYLRNLAIVLWILFITLSVRTDFVNLRHFVTGLFEKGLCPC